MNESYENLCTRRSVRKFNDKKVSHDLVEKIVQAGQYAPSGMNRQSYAFVVVENEEILSELSRMNAAIMNSDKDPYYGAKTIIIVFANTEVPTYQYDGSLAIGNLLNAAHSLGVDSCWIHRAKEMFKTEKGIEFMNKWGIPESYEGIGNCILGYRDGELPSASKRTSMVVYD